MLSASFVLIFQRSRTALCCYTSRRRLPNKKELPKQYCLAGYIFHKQVIYFNKQVIYFMVICHEPVQKSECYLSLYITSCHDSHLLKVYYVLSFIIGALYVICLIFTVAVQITQYCDFINEASEIQSFSNTSKTEIKQQLRCLSF